MADAPSGLSLTPPQRNKKKICYVGDYSCALILSAVCSLISFCSVVDNCGEIIVYVVYVVSCVAISLFTAVGFVVVPVLLVLIVLTREWSDPTCRNLP
jgi:hypothetical protein